LTVFSPEFTQGQVIQEKKYHANQQALPYSELFKILSGSENSLYYIVTEIQLH